LGLFLDFQSPSTPKGIFPRKKSTKIQKRV